MSVISYVQVNTVLDGNYTRGVNVDNLSVDSDFADLLSTQKDAVSICDVRDSTASSSTYQRVVGYAFGYIAGT